MLVLLACAGAPSDSLPAKSDSEDMSCGDGRVWYPDADGDGFGDLENAVAACEAPPGHVEDYRDCDDADASAHPGGDESTCDGVDSDCDGDYDEDAPGAVEWYRDADGDGFGDGEAVVLGCDVPPGATADASDCDDTVASAYPGGVDSCGDSIDGDCDGIADAGCGEGVVVDVDSLPHLHGSEEGLVLIGYGPEIGMALATGGDVTGDGADDLLIGLPHEHRGEVYYSGRVRIVSEAPAADEIFEDGSAAIDGLSEWTWFGEAVAIVPDLDGDDVDEVLAGAPSSGSVLLFRGGGGALTTDDAVAVFLGAEGSGAGSPIAPAGDVTGEPGGFAIAAPDANTVSVAAGLHSGSISLDALGTRIVGDDATICLGEGLAGAGDTDGDGIDDLVVGACGRCVVEITAGEAWVLPGPLTGTVSVGEAAAHVTGTRDYDGLGCTVAGAGDIDGDGLADVAVAASWQSIVGPEPGHVVILGGGRTGEWPAADVPIRLVGSALDYAFGHTMASAGDLDDDGRDDLVVGVPQQDVRGRGSGGAYVLLGLAAGTWTMPDGAWAALTSGRTYSAYGGALAAGSDLDDDGFADVFLGGMGVDQEGMVAFGTSGRW